VTSSSSTAGVGSDNCLLCGRPNRPHYGSCPSVRPSVCLSVCPVRASSWKAETRR